MDTATCPPWCVSRGRHLFHQGRQSVIVNPAPEPTEPPVLLRVELTSEGVFIQGETVGVLDAQAAIRVAAGLRARAGDLEEMAAWM